MLLRNIGSSCRFRAPTIAGKSTSLCDLKSSNLLHELPSRFLHLSKKELGKIRDPKDFTWQSGRPDDPKKKVTKKWTGRPETTCEQRDTHRDTSAIDKSQMPKASDVKNPGMWTGRPEETCVDRKLAKEKPLDSSSAKHRASTKKNLDGGIKPKKGKGSFGSNEANFVSSSGPNIRTPILNVEMSKTSGLPPPNVATSSIAEVQPSQHLVPPSLVSESIKRREKVIAAQENFSSHLGGVHGQTKNDLPEPDTSSSGSVKISNVGPSLVAVGLLPSKTSQTFCEAIAIDIPEHHVDVMSQRSSIRTGSLVSKEKRSINVPVEAENASASESKQAYASESHDRQKSELSRSVENRSKVDLKISGMPKLKIVKETFNEKRRHRVYSFGLSETGALGLYKPNEGRRWRKFISRPLRHQFAEETRVISAESGYGFTLFYVQSENNVKLYGCGINTDFQLGPTDAEVVTYPSPMDIHIRSPSTKIISFSAGRAHCAVATDNEGVFLLGSNSYGQCGRAVDEEDKSAPACTITQIKSFGGEKAVGVNCGQDHTCFITESGKVYACGWGSEGQTGLGHTSHSCEPSLVRGDIAEENIIKVTGKCDTVLALNEKGELFGWGSNEFRQIIDDRDIAQVDSPLRMDHVNKLCGKIVDVAAGSSFCMVLNDNGDVFVWGNGILGGGPELDRTTVPTLLPRTLFGTNEYQPKVIPLRVYCGLDHMAVMNSSNHVYTWGKNKHGCLGIGNARDQYFPYKLAISANAVHVSCAVDHSVIVTDHN